MKSKKWKIVSILLLIIICFLFPSPGSAKARGKETKSQILLRREIDFFIKKSRTPQTVKAIEIYSRKNRKILFQSDSQLLLRPASNLKIVTTSFALHNLTSSYEFKTLFLVSGIRRDEAIEGNLIVELCGDPIVTDGDLDSVARSISQSGIRRITGNLIIDVSQFDSLQWGSGWMWDDEPGDYQMFISPACLDHNAIIANVSLDSLNHHLSITTTPQTNFVHILSTAVPDTTDSLFVTRVMENDTNTIVVSGKYSPHLRQFQDAFSVRHPAHYFGTVLKEMLSKHGIKLSGEVLVEPRDWRPRTESMIDTLFILEHSIDTVITYTNKVSDNLGAECLLRIVPNAIYGQTGSAENGLKLEKDFLTQCGVDSSQYFIVDGSGLSHYDLITPEAIVSVLNCNLNQMVKNPDSANSTGGMAEIFVHSLPIAGKDGTLEKRMCRNFEIGKVVAKTGSISGVSTLSGYVMLPKDTLIFSMMMQNFIPGNGDSMRTLQDSICTLLALYNTNARLYRRGLIKYHVGTYGAARRARLRHKMEMAHSGIRQKRVSHTVSQKKTTEVH